MDDDIGCFGFVLLLLIFLCWALRGFLVNESVAVNAMTSAGYSDVQVVEKYHFYPLAHGCDDSDAAGFKVSAVNPQGKRITAIVCSGLMLKGATIRFK